MSRICQTRGFRMIINKMNFVNKHVYFAIIPPFKQVTVMKNRNIEKISVVIIVIFYFLAGMNHFIHPQGYYRIIPRYLPFPVVLNIIAGFFEILFALLMIRPKTRKVAAWGIILMLAAFLPIHITMLFNAPLKVGNLLVTPLIAWLRLLLQPVLMLWAWWHTKL